MLEVALEEGQGQGRGLEYGALLPTTSLSPGGAQMPQL